MTPSDRQYKEKAAEVIAALKGNNILDSPGPIAAPWLRHGSLVSWWDMQQFSAFRFCSLMSLIDGFVEMLRLGDFHGSIDSTIRRPDISGSHGRHIATRLENLKRECDGLGLEFSSKAIARMVSDIRHELGHATDSSAGRIPLSAAFEHEFSEVRSRIADEMSSASFFCISGKHSERYRNPLHGWELIVDRFPSVRNEIEEASKCSAVGRTTATVFHLMRVMERGLAAIGRDLKIKKQNPTWDAILGAVDGKLNPKPRSGKPAPKRRRRSRVHEQFIAESTVHLRAVKVAWRNPVMHKVENVYDDARADEVYSYVQSFMRHLATRLHE